MWRWAPKTRYKLRRTIASIIEDLGLELGFGLNLRSF